MTCTEGFEERVSAWPWVEEFLLEKISEECVELPLTLATLCRSDDENVLFEQAYSGAFRRLICSFVVGDDAGHVGSRKTSQTGALAEEQCND